MNSWTIVSDCAMPVPDFLDGFEVSDAVGRMLDQPLLWWQAVGLFVEHFAAWPAAWQGSIGNDAAECRLVHAVGSAAANVGATELLVASSALEQCLRKRQAGQPAPLAEPLRTRLQVAFDRAWGAADRAMAETGAMGEDRS